MPLFTGRDRIAIALFSALILAGWGARWHLHRAETPPDIRVIRGAVTPPPPAAASGSLAAPSAAPGASADSLRIDLNRAAAAELEALPMIGPAKAAAIIRWREENGPFAQPADLMKVKGIGPKIYEKVKPYVRVEAER